MISAACASAATPTSHVLREGLVGAQFWAAFQPTNAPHPARTALEQIDLIRRMEEAYPETFFPARRAGDVARAKRAGKIASFIAVEGGVGLEEALAPLRVWRAAGARLMTLCHNESLYWVDSATDAPRAGGLNAFGRAVIGELNRLGMVVDCAHVSHDAMRQVLDVAEAPIALSHSNAFALCDHPRNAPDDVLKRLKDNGGLVMATFVPGFISQALRDWLAVRATITARRRRGSIRRRRSPPSRPSRGRRRARHWSNSPTISSISSRPPASITSASVRISSAALRRSGSKTSAGFLSCLRNWCAAASLERDLEKMSSKNMLRVLRRVETVSASLRKTKPPTIGRLEDYPGA